MLRGGIDPADRAYPGRTNAEELRIDALQRHLAEVEGGIFLGFEHGAGHPLPVAHAVAGCGIAEARRGALAQLQVAIQAIGIQRTDGQEDPWLQLAEGKRLLGQEVGARPENINIVFGIFYGITAHEAGIADQGGAVSLDSEGIVDRGQPAPTDDVRGVIHVDRQAGHDADRVGPGLPLA